VRVNAARPGASAAVICVLAFAPAASRATTSAPDMKELVRRYGLAMHFDKIANLRSETRTSMLEIVTVGRSGQ